MYQRNQLLHTLHAHKYTRYWCITLVDFYSRLASYLHIVQNLIFCCLKVYSIVVSIVYSINAYVSHTLCCGKVQFGGQISNNWDKYMQLNHLNGKNVIRAYEWDGNDTVSRLMSSPPIDLTGIQYMNAGFFLQIQGWQSLHDHKNNCVRAYNGFWSALFPWKWFSGFPRFRTGFILLLWNNDLFR